MPLNPRNRRPLRVLAALFVIVAGLYGLLASVHTWGEAQLTPKLGLDLEGGTQLILEPKVVGNRAINQGQIDKAVDIIRQRVDGSGVAEAEVATQGGRNIVISLPGKPPQSTVDSLSKSSQLRFRPVLVETPNAAPAPTPSATPSATPSGSPATPSGKATATPSAKATTPRPKATAKPSGTASTSAGSGFPEALRAPAAATPSRHDRRPRPRPPRPRQGHARRDGDQRAGAHPTAPVPAPTAPATDAAKGTASDLAQITPPIEKQLTSLDCTKPAQVQAIVDDPDKVMVTCSVDGTSKYILGPAEVEGQDVKDAASGAELNQQGAPTGGYEIRLSFNGKGTKEFGDVTTRLVGLQPPQNQFAIVLDNQVISAPQTNAAITNGSASITGNFTAESARLLADQIKFGALPLSFSLQTQDDISPQLGSDQLQKGLIAGAIGLLLVVLYSLFQYRALGLVTVASLLVASVHHLRRGHAPRLVARLPADHGRCHGPDRLDRHHGRLVHRLLRTRPRRGARGPAPAGGRRDGLEARPAHHPDRRRGQPAGGGGALRPRGEQRARLRLHPDADHDHRHHGRHPLHPPPGGDPRQHEVLR